METVKKPGNEFADIVYTALNDNREPVFDVGFMRENLMDTSVYVTFSPRYALPKAKASFWKKAKAKFEESTKKYRLFCRVEKTDKTALRFVKFFGFRQVGMIGTTYNFVKD